LLDGPQQQDSAIRLPRRCPDSRIPAAFSFRAGLILLQRRVPLPAVRFLPSFAVLAAVAGAAVRAGAGGRRRCGADRFSCFRRVNGHGWPL